MKGADKGCVRAYGNLPYVRNGGRRSKMREEGQRGGGWCVRAQYTYVRTYVHTYARTYVGAGWGGGGIGGETGGEREGEGSGPGARRILVIWTRSAGHR